MKFEVERSAPGIGAVRIILDIYQEQDDPRMIAAVHDLEGTIRLPPKAWLATVRTELKLIEDEARKAGCSELRFVGRFTRRMFPDYEPYEPLSGLPGLRKAL